MKTFLCLCLAILIHGKSAAQVSDNFADNNFNVDPVWSGEESKFVGVTSQLKLQAPAVTSTAFLSTPSSSINNASWEFFVQLDFNPSSTNLVNVYLVADQADLSGALNGYLVKIGNTADEISLYRQDNNVEIKIIDGLDGRLNLSTVKTNIRVTRDREGNWQLFSDVGLTGTYLSEGTVTDQTYVATRFFGVNCKYTETRSDKFRFDDFVVTGDPFIDVDPPKLQLVKTVSGNVIDLTFSEAVQSVSAITLGNYFVNHDVGHPTSATAIATNTVQLSFTKNFPNGIECTLTASHVLDILGNELLPVNKTFLFFQATPTQKKDVVITEIMADPNPPTGLPNAEFIEVLNRSTVPIDIGNWTFAKGASPEKFPYVILLPGEYLIFTAVSNASLFSTHGKVVALSNFSTLNNSGDGIVLKNAENITIDSVQYKDTWYSDDDKKQGGWTLELIDPMNTCAERDNWIASEDSLGGTPGKQNSVYANKPDLTGPVPLHAIPTSPGAIKLTFNEKLQKTQPPIINFKIEPAITLSEVIFADASLASLILKTREILVPGTNYTITISDVNDCAGNILQQEFNTLEFGLPQPVDSLDVVINEILFNPRATGVDFVELYNTSDNYINLKNWSVTNADDSVLTKRKTITAEDYLLKPLGYVVLTTNNVILKGEYPQGREETFLEVESLPGLNDEDGSFVVLDDAQKIIADVHYTKDQHSPFIKDEEGVSLERISSDQTVMDSQNWRSASSASGFATPGFVNSNYARQTAMPDESVKVEPEIFIPAYGSPNFTEIKYGFTNGGYVANVKIYDPEGREIKQIATNEILGTSGVFRWDGDQNNGRKARIGYYIVRFEVFNSGGAVKTFHRRVVVATQF
jgi:hypothetical protein